MIVIIALIAATWLITPAVPLLARQALLTIWGVGAIFAVPADFIMVALVPHMAVTLISMYLVFVLDTLWHSPRHVLH